MALAPASSTPRLMEDRGTLQDSQRRFDAVDTAEAHGAGVGRALQNLGNKGSEIVAEFAQREAERDANEADAEFQRRTREIMLGRQPKPDDPDDEGVRGFLTMEGEDAVANRATVEQRLADIRADIANRRSTQAARRAFEDVSRRRLESTLGEADRHVGQQQRVMEDAARESLAQESRNSAVSAYLNENEAAANINAGIHVVTDQADADGASAERTEAMIRDYQSSAWAAVIMRRAEDDPDGAQAIFEARRGTMNAEDVMRVEGATREVVLRNRARNNVTELRAEHGGDFDAILQAIEGIQSTAERDETRARFMGEVNEEQQLQARHWDNTEERVRGAISRGGFDAVAGADRYELQVAGRWNGLVAEYQARANSGGEATRRNAQNQVDIIMLMSQENAPGFHVVVDAMRGIRTPGVSDEMIAQASGGLTREQLVGMRNSIMAVNASAFTELVTRQQEMRGQRPVGQSNDSNIQRIANRAAEIGEARAAARGMDVRRPSLSAVVAGNGARQERRNAEWRAFFMQEARDHVAAYGGRDPTQEEMDQMIARALARGNGGMAFEARRAPEGSVFGIGGTRVTVPFSEIDIDTQRALHRAYRQEHRLGTIEMQRIPEGLQRQYAAQWRRDNPGVEVAPGSRAEQELEAYIREAYTDDPARTSRLGDRRSWMEGRYADDLQRY